MKGLEALEKIDHTICLNNLAKNIVWNIDKEENCDCKSVEQFVDCYDTIEKELKALEIIKTKKVASFLLIWLMNKHAKKTALELYNRGCDEDRQLNEEEYDLLKEVLC